MMIFLNLLQKICKDFIQKINDLLMYHFADYLEDRYLLQKFQFKQLILKTLQSYNMNLNDFLFIYKSAE